METFWNQKNSINYQYKLDIADVL